MSRVFLNNNAINQKGTPLLYTDILSNRPKYGINGRLFFSTDSQQIFEDTGTSWLLLADATGSVSGYVPYVGATTNLNLGLFNITATSLITSGGTSSQFVKGNGTLDSTTYVSLTAISGTSPIQYNNTTGVISILQSNTSQSGYLSSTDWNTFNNKASLTAFSATTPLSYNSGTGAFSIQVANTGQSGYLTNTDWNTFNGKQSALSFGNLTETSSSILNITGGTGAVIGSGTTIAVNQANSTQSGYLSSTDWNTFNNKQPQINGTGFVKASGTTISYDNSTYLTTTTAGTTYVPYTGATGAVNLGTNTLASGAITSSGTVTATDFKSVKNGSASVSSQFQLGSASGTVYGANLQLGTTGSLDFWTYDVASLGWGKYLSIAATGAATFSSSVTAGGSMYFVNTGGVFATGAALNGLSANSTTNIVSILTSGSERMRITSGGNLLVGSTTDNGKKLQVNGTTTTSGFAASGATYTVSATVSEQYYHVFTGAVGQTLTLLSPSSNNLQYVIINNSANTLTVAAAASTNIINTVGSSVSTITLIANQRVFLIADGNNKYYQIF